MTVSLCNFFKKTDGISDMKRVLLKKTTNGIKFKMENTYQCHDTSKTYVTLPKRGKRMDNITLPIIPLQKEVERVSFERGGSEVLLPLKPVVVMRWTKEERAFVVEAYFFNGRSVVAIQRAFRTRFNIHPEGPVPSRQSIVSLGERISGKQCGKRKARRSTDFQNPRKRREGEAVVFALFPAFGAQTRSCSGDF